MSFTSVTKNVPLNCHLTSPTVSSSGWDSKENLLPFKNLTDEESIAIVNHAIV